MTRRREATDSEIGRAILSRLRKRGWSQRDLAAVTGLSVAFISDVIGGHRRLGVAMALRLSAAFGDLAPTTWLVMQREIDEQNLARELGQLRVSMAAELAVIEESGRRRATIRAESA